MLKRTAAAKKRKNFYDRVSEANKTTKKAIFEFHKKADQR